MNGESLDITSQNIARLKELFPEILTDGGKIDIDMLKTVLGEVVETEQERYQFTWSGKKKMIEGAQKSSKGTLRPVPEKSKNFDTTENLYIEGDNLEVLKLLQKSYNGKIKMIYIDPPYNTGRDFVYKDNFKDGVQNYLEQTGQVDTDGNLLSTNAESNGRFHTDWLNMMYARLKLSRNLLSDKGVICINIGEEEHEKLKFILNEIYGEKNLLGTIIWKKKTNGNNQGHIPSIHDYIYCYAKKIEMINEKEIGLLPTEEFLTKNYSNPDNDPRGIWTTQDLSANHEGPYFSIENPNTGEIHYPPKGRYWVFNEKEVQRRISEGRIIFGKRGITAPVQKVFYNEKEYKKIKVSSIWSDIALNADATAEISELFEQPKIFSHPKPVGLLKRLLEVFTEENDLILDFFSGSATTAHATIQLNSEDGGSRKFILVQLPETLDEKSEAHKNGYRTICDIGEERIRRAGEKVKVELKEKQQQAGMLDENIVDPDTLDIGFKLLKLDTSNIREWNVEFTNLEEALDLYETPFIDGRSELDIVYEIMLKQGLELTYPIVTFEVNGKMIYDIAFGSLFICLASGIKTDIAKAIIARRDELGTETSSVIFSDASFNSDSEKLNCIEVLKDAGYPEDNLLTI